MSNSKDPAFLFYSADFLVGVMDLTDEETGQYIKLICLQHQKGRLKKESIYRMFPNISDSVLEKFEIDKNGLYYNSRVEEEIEKRENYIQSRSANGSKGGRPPKNVQSTQKPYGLAYENHSENENINENINDIDNKNNLYFQRFDEFWCAYPKKVNKDRAMHKFMHIKPNEELFKKIMDALEMHKRSKQWQDKEFVPHPTTWLNGKRWEDELSESECSSFDTDDFFQSALERSYRK
jgi:hypothetical protein